MAALRNEDFLKKVISCHEFNFKIDYHDIFLPILSDQPISNNYDSNIP